jgi:hypothetical protein
MPWVNVELKQLVCAGCGEPGPAGLSRIDAAIEAVAVGWTYTGWPLRRDSRWRCPTCRERGRATREGRPS